MKTLFNDGSTVPTAFVTRSRQRVKQYNNETVYLNNGEEFEIELFNPTTNKVLAKIELNGVSLGSGIILRPGERVFLERYLNESRKFLFETYEVDGNNQNVRKAIENNGTVDVKFYCEQTYFGGTTYWPPFSSPIITYTTSGGYAPKTPTFYEMSADINNQGEVSQSSVYYYNAGGAGESNAPKTEFKASLSKNIETGRVEKGSNSNQSFTYDNTSFNSWWTWNSTWKILPFSQKPLEYRDLKVYCTKCGTKQRKPSDSFCPKCGTKY
jgi:hypothetical protein